MKLILVTWRDAHGDANGWTAKSGLGKEARIITSIGWWIEDAKPDHLSIAQSFDTQADTVDSVLHIPIGMIVEWHWIDYGE